MSDLHPRPDWHRQVVDEALAAGCPVPALGDIPDSPPPARQPAYDAVCALLAEHPGLPPALVWRAVDVALDAMGVPRGRAWL